MPRGPLWFRVWKRIWTRARGGHERLSIVEDKTMKEKTAGILGGMGPEATVDLMRRIIAHTDARDDADHVRCIVDNNPRCPRASRPCWRALRCT